MSEDRLDRIYRGLLHVLLGILMVGIGQLFVSNYRLSMHECPASIKKMSYDDLNIVIYYEGRNSMEVIPAKNQSRVFFGKVELLKSDDELLLITPWEKINLAEKGEGVYCINEAGEIIYHLVGDDGNEKEMVYATPSGKKYHYDSECAGATAFEVSLESAELFREPCNICAEKI